MNKKFIFQSAFIFISSFILYSCSKNAKEQNSMTSKADIIMQYSQSLSKDEDFIKNFTIDKELFSHKLAPSKLLNDDNYQKFGLDLLASKSNDDFINAFKRYDPINGQNIANLLLAKKDVLLKVKEKFPGLVYLNQSEFNKLYMDSYSKVTLKVAVTMNQPGCNNGCCNSYVLATNSCDTDFTVNTGYSIVVGVVTTILGTPVAGAFFLSAGIGGAYLTNLNCNNNAAINYRACMGY